MFVASLANWNDLKCTFIGKPVYLSQKRLFLSIFISFGGILRDGRLAPLVSQRVILKWFALRFPPFSDDEFYWLLCVKMLACFIQLNHFNGILFDLIYVCGDAIFFRWLSILLLVSFIVQFSVYHHRHYLCEPIVKFVRYTHAWHRLSSYCTQYSRQS